MFFCFFLYSLLVYSANSSDVKHVFVSGKQVVNNHMLNVSLTQLRKDLQEQMGDFNIKAKELAEKIG